MYTSQYKFIKQTCFHIKTVAYLTKCIMFLCVLLLLFSYALKFKIIYFYTDNFIL